MKITNFAAAVAFVASSLARSLDSDWEIHYDFVLNIQGYSVSLLSSLHAERSIDRDLRARNAKNALRAVTTSGFQTRMDARIST